MTDHHTDHIEALIDGYLDSTLTEAQHAELFAALETDRALLKRFAQLTELDAICREHAGQQLEAELIQSQMLPFEAGFEDDAELPLIQLDANALTKEKYASALSYVVRHTFTPKRIAVLATAAACLLGVVLTIAILTGPDDADLIAVSPDTPTASTQSTPRGADPTSSAIVATLTAEHNAVWASPQAEGALAPVSPGSPLRAGTRLMLTQGFAEITTQRGAVAILEVPCTVEFSDSPNALRLTNGKLVASCLTPESKGFAVLAGDTRIVDIGTEFGVAIDEAGGVDVQVFTGLVVADVVAEDGQIKKQPLVEGESARIASGRFEKRLSDDALAFTRALPYEATAPQLTGNIRWAATPLKDLDVDGFADASQAYVFLERAGAMVPADLEVNKFAASEPIDLYKRSSFAAPVHADVYLLRFSPGEQIGSVTGTIRFDRPILGVIPHYLRLESSDATLGLPGVKFGKGHPGRGMENGKASFGDDARTLNIHIDQSSGQDDELRILVAPASVTTE